LSDNFAKLSAEARELLEAGREFVRETFAARELVNGEHSEWNLLTWDAGYYQAYKIYAVRKEIFAKSYEKLAGAREKLEGKIRTWVYAEGILEK
jgi:hypothetical protein